MIRPMPRLRDIAWMLLVSLVAASAVRADESLPTFEDARRLLAQAEAAAGTADPRLAAIARMNAESARKLMEARAVYDQATDDAHVLATKTAALARIKESDEQRVRLVGSGSGPVTEVLMRHREHLPALGTERRELESLRGRAASTEIARLDAEEALASLEQGQSVAADLVRAYPEGAADADALAPLLKLRADRYVRPLVDALGACSRVLAADEATRTEYTAMLASYREFVDAHLVWLPSMPAAGAEDARGASAFVAWIGSRAFWSGISSDLVDSVRFRPFRWFGGGLLVAALFFLRRKVSRLLGGADGQSTSGLAATSRSVLETAVIASPVPAALAIVGTLVEQTPTASTAEPFAAAMLGVSGLAFLTSFVAALSVSGGAAERQLRWSAAATASLRHAALVIGNIALPALFLALAALWSDGADGSDAVARWAIVVALAVLTIVTAHIFRPSHGVLSGIIARNPSGWISILRPVWYPAMVALPAMLAIGAVAGYVITATTVIDNIGRSYWVILLLAIGVSALEGLGDHAMDHFDLAGDLEAKEQIRFEQQVRNFGRLLLAIILVLGFAWAWQDLIPALSVINGITVWTVAGVNGGPAVAVSIRDMLLFLATIVITVAVLRDLPGIVNIAVLRRFPIERSARYALVAVGRYVLVIIGLVLALACLRIRWNDVQWLAAAVTVGLGFGLQEIFANFVSGLILLAERPVRIGDLVTIDGISGRISRIATRATTVVDFDNKDVIIPNKQLITGRITNWTLQEPSIRVMLRVAVPADADLTGAVTALREAAAGSLGVLASPGPEVLLVSFTGGTAEIDVSVYVARPSDMQPARHDLVLRAQRILTERGIEIAFPQLEVHMRGPAAARQGT
jgi:potassium efflux system protein